MADDTERLAEIQARVDEHRVRAITVQPAVGYFDDALLASVDDVAWLLARCQRLEAERDKAMEALETLRGDVHHWVNPVVGRLRLEADRPDWHKRPLDPLDLVERLRKATDAADAALDERPMREQLAEMQAEIAAARGVSVPETP